MIGRGFSVAKGRATRIDMLVFLFEKEVEWLLYTYMLRRR